MILHSSADEFSDWLARAKESALIDFSLSNHINMRHPDISEHFHTKIFPDTSEICYYKNVPIFRVNPLEFKQEGSRYYICVTVDKLRDMSP